jgi:hypothetical protein
MTRDPESQTKEKKMKKFKVSLSVDQDWVNQFNLVYEAENESEAESLALMEVSQNLSDYFTTEAEEVKDE